MQELPPEPESVEHFEPRAIEAARDLRRYARDLERAASRLPVSCHAFALELMRDYRIFAFERDLRRWPDGRFHVTDRHRREWRGHHLAFDREDLNCFGIEGWRQRVVRQDHSDSLVLLQNDAFQTKPKRHLWALADIVREIADEVFWASGETQ